MAYVRFKDGRRKVIPDRIAARIWLGKNGFYAMDEEQASFARTVESISLYDYITAPDEYIRRNLMSIIPQVLKTWLVDPSGCPVRPSNREGYIFAEKWGLWAKGKPTSLVISPEQQLLLV